MEYIRNLIKKTLINEVAGVSFITRKWADILDREVDKKLEEHEEEYLKKLNPEEKSPIDDPFYWQDETGRGLGSMNWSKSGRKKDYEIKGGKYYKRKNKYDYEDLSPSTPKSYGQSSYNFQSRQYIPKLEEVVINGQDFPEAYKEFSVDYWVFKNSTRIEYDHYNSGYDKDNNYVVYFNVPVGNLSKGAFIHEIKHAYDDWNRMRHGAKPIRDSWEIKNIYTKDFEKLVLGGSVKYPQLGSLVRDFYLGSKLETPAYLENEYDTGATNYEQVGRRLKNFKIDRFFDKQGNPARGLEDEFKEIQKLDIPLFKKFKNVTEFLNWTKNYFNKRGEDIFRRVVKMKAVHGKPITGEPKYEYKFEPKKEEPKKTEPKKEEEYDWSEFESGSIGDWKFSKERGWYYAGEDDYEF
jgi:hypothetical protein